MVFRVFELMINTVVVIACFPNTTNKCSHKRSKIKKSIFLLPFFCFIGPNSTYPDGSGHLERS